MITKEERERDKALCEKAQKARAQPAAEEAKKRAEQIMAHLRTLPLAPDGRSPEGDTYFERLEIKSAFVARAYDAFPKYIADAEEMDRRIERVAALLPDLPPIDDYGNGRDDAVHAALAILRGEV